MRVLVVADVVGGVRTFALELARGLVARGIELDLALIGADAAPEFAELGVSSLEVRNLRLEWMEDAWGDVEAAAEWVRELCEAHKPDVVHLNTFTPVGDPDLPVLLTVHSCVLTWWRSVHGRDAPASWERYRTLARDALTRADGIVAPTRALLEQLRAVYGPLRSTRVIPNGRRVDGIALGSRERIVLSAGRAWDAAKNIGAVAQAAPLIDGRVVVIGAGASRLAGVEAVGVLPPEAVLEWMARAAVFAEPARYEPFGLAALEAALCGCALVLGDIASLREVWGDAATFVDPDDVERLAHEVNRLLDDPAARARAARRAGAAAVRYTPDAMADGYLHAYEQLVAVGAPA